MLARLSALILLTGAFSLTACSPAKPAPPPPGGPEVCDNGVDDDNNGKTDCADPVCFHNTSCVTAVELCGNGADDDGNNLIDCADPACAQDSSCAPKQE